MIQKIESEIIQIKSDEKKQSELFDKKRLFEENFHNIQNKLKEIQNLYNLFKLGAEEEKNEIENARLMADELEPIVLEANNLSVDLTKKTKFEICLVYSKAKKVILDPCIQKRYYLLKIEPAVIVVENFISMAHYKYTGDSVIWTIEEFKQKFEKMKEYYKNSKSNSKFRSSIDNDPFYQTKKVVKIGCANLDISILSYLIDITDSIPIINETNKKIMGNVHVRILVTEISGDNKFTLKKTNDELSKIIGKSLKLSVEIDECVGINQRNFSDVFIRFSFINSTTIYETQPCVEQSSHPQIKFRQGITICPVTEKLVEKIKSEKIVFQVFGTQSGLDSFLPKTVRNSPYVKNLEHQIRNLQAEAARQTSERINSMKELSIVNNKAHVDSENTKSLKKQIELNEKTIELLQNQNKELNIKIRKIQLHEEQTRSALETQIEKLQTENKSLKRQIGRLEEQQIETKIINQQTSRNGGIKMSNSSSSTIVGTGTGIAGFGAGTISTGNTTPRFSSITTSPRSKISDQNSGRRVVSIKK
eukprot:c12962_g1_i3.p1 GENE.c12962_g1_i3~~c12962_g1_i3.p1  ORF type:complete len:618 (-),score=171.68 c12962_g1_i3:19-1617(-)